MEENSAVVSYLKKLKRLINYESDFAFLQYKFVKASRVDDILACILAAVPDSYKNILKRKSRSLYLSIVSFNALIKLIKKKFFLFPDLYVVRYADANQMLDTIIKSIDNDIANIEEHD